MERTGKFNFSAYAMILLAPSQLSHLPVDSRYTYCNPDNFPASLLCYLLWRLSPSFLLYLSGCLFLYILHWLLDIPRQLPCVHSPWPSSARFLTVLSSQLHPAPIALARLPVRSHLPPCSKTWCFLCFRHPADLPPTEYYLPEYLEHWQQSSSVLSIDVTVQSRSWTGPQM